MQESDANSPATSRLATRLEAQVNQHACEELVGVTLAGDRAVGGVAEKALISSERGQVPVLGEMPDCCRTETRILEAGIGTELMKAAAVGIGLLTPK